MTLLGNKPTVASSAQAGHMHVGKGLNEKTLGVVGSAVIGLSSVAPLYSLAATLGYVILAVGGQAPVAFLAACIPMVFAAFAYQELNREMPDCGTTFVWGAKAFGPITGWIGGWAVAVSAIMCNANVSEIASTYFLYLIHADNLVNNRAIVVFGGCVFIALMTLISAIGIQIGERMQLFLMVIQFSALILFGIFAFVGALDGSSPTSVPFNPQWFNPFALHSWHGFIEAVLLCLFIYWGWDTCLALNEETKNPRKTPAQAALATIVILIFLYVGISVAVMMYAGMGSTGFGLTNQKNLDDVFTVLRSALFGWWGWFLVLAMLVSAMSSTQTTILPTARGTLSMAVYGALPKKFAEVHPKYKTPMFSTIVMGVSSIAYYAGMSAISENVLQDSLTSMGLAVALYYALTAFSCVVYYRKTIFQSTRNFFMRGLFPLLGGLMLTYAFIQSAIDMWDPNYGETVLLGVGGAFVLGIGSLAIGYVFIGMWWLSPKSRPFFRGESLNKDTPVLVPEE